MAGFILLALGYSRNLLFAALNLLLGIQALFYLLNKTETSLQGLKFCIVTMISFLLIFVQCNKS